MAVRYMTHSSSPSSTLVGRAPGLPKPSDSAASESSSWSVQVTASDEVRWWTSWVPGSRERDDPRVKRAVARHRDGARQDRAAIRHDRPGDDGRVARDVEDRPRFGGRLGSGAALRRCPGRGRRCRWRRRRGRAGDHGRCQHRAERHGESAIGASKGKVSSRCRRRTVPSACQLPPGVGPETPGIGERFPSMSGCSQETPTRRGVTGCASRSDQPLHAM